MNVEDIFKAANFEKIKMQLVFILISMAAITLLIYLFYSAYLANQTYEAIRSEYSHTSSQVLTVNQSIKYLLKKESAYFDSLRAAPSTKTDLSEGLTTLLSANKLRVTKLSSNFSKLSSGQKEGLVELDADGSYPQIVEFLHQMESLAAASNVEFIRLTKTQDNLVVHLSLGVKFASPPDIRNMPKRLAFNMNGQQFFYDSFDQWRLKTAGFVAVPDSAANKSEEAPTVKESLNVTRIDPFQLPIPPPLSANGTTKSAGAFFLSGIVYSAKGKLCIITLPSGESKIYLENEKVNEKMRVEHVDMDDVRISSKITKAYKVGEEIL